MKKTILKAAFVLFAIVILFTLSSCVAVDSDGNQSFDILGSFMLLVLLAIIVFIPILITHSRSRARRDIYTASPYAGSGAKIFCRYCGASIDADSKFCKNCGANVV